MSTRPSFTVEYLDPISVEAEPLPDEFSLVTVAALAAPVAAIVLVVVAAIVLVPGLGSLRDTFAGAEPRLARVRRRPPGSAPCASYVLVFRAVFCRRMSWRTSTEIGLSELAANSVFSIGGAGGLALGAWILRRGGLPAAFIAHRTVAFFLLTSLANVSFLGIGGIALATGLLNGSMPLLGLIPAVAAVLAVALALAMRRLAGALAQRSMRARLAAGAGAVADGVDEALRLLRTGDPALFAGAAGYMLFDVAMLGVCFAAFGNDVPPAGVLLVAYIIGQLGSLIPIPAGSAGRRRPDRHTRDLRRRRRRCGRRRIAYRGLLLSIPALLGLPALAVLRRRLRDEAHDIAACAPGETVEVLGPRDRAATRAGRADASG